MMYQIALNWLGPIRDTEESVFKIMGPPTAFELRL